MQTQTHEKQPLLAILLTVFPGMGHIYLGKYGRGLFYIAAAIAPLFLMFFVMIVSRGPEREHLFLLFLYWFGLIFVNFIDMVLTLGMSRRPYPPQEAGYFAPPSANTERFQTLLLSFIPGLGHFHLGLLQRGLIFFAAFFGGGVLCVLLAFMTHNESVFFFGLVGLPVIWILSQWDAAQAVQQKQRGELVLGAGLPMDQKKLTALLFSLFPGAGHMYMGHRRKGVQLMAMFLLALYLGEQLDWTLLGYVLPLIWFFSFFDVYHRYHSYMETEEDIPGRWIVGIAWFLILSGFLGLLDEAMFGLAPIWFPEWDFHYVMTQYIRPILFSLVLIGVGVRMLLNNKKSA